MAQTGYTPILIYSSSTASNAPAAGNLTNSTLGSELAINITDGKLFYKDNGGSVQVIGWKTVPTTAGGTGLTSYTAGDVLYYASGTTLSKLAIGTAYYQLGVNAGGTAPAWQPSATSVLTTQGDLLYASAANTLARLAKNTTATRYLANTGTSNNPDWAQVDLTNGVTGTLPTTNGGTGLTSFTANGLLYASSTSALATGSALTWDGANILTMYRKTNTDSAEPTVKFSNDLFSGQNPGLVKSANGGLALDIQSPSTSTYQDRSRLYMNGGTGSIMSFQTSADNGSTWTTQYTLDTGNFVPAVAAKGINFTANTAAAGMTSQLLNWYEEGTWTPIYSPTSGAFTSVTYGSGRYGRYTRIGRMVAIQGIILTDAITIGTAAGLLRIAGLPYSSANDSAVFAGYSVNFNTNNPIGGYTSGSTIYLTYRSTANGATSNSVIGDLDTGASYKNYLVFSASYIV